MVIDASEEAAGVEDAVGVELVFDLAHEGDGVSASCPSGRWSADGSGEREG